MDTVLFLLLSPSFRTRNLVSDDRNRPMTHTTPHRHLLRHRLLPTPATAPTPVRPTAVVDTSIHYAANTSIAPDVSIIPRHDFLPPRIVQSTFHTCRTLPTVRPCFLPHSIEVERWTGATANRTYCHRNSAGSICPVQPSDENRS